MLNSSPINLIGPGLNIQPKPNQSESFSGIFHIETGNQNQTFPDICQQEK